MTLATLATAQLEMALWGLVRTLHSHNLFNLFPFQAYSLVDREVGYCQGSAFIVGLLLMQVRGHPGVHLQEMGTRDFPISSDHLGPEPSSAASSL